jgi:putative two-component system response regulator
VGATIVRNIKGQDIDFIATIIRHHHERFDGRGYPDGLSGEDIPMLARVLAVADSYDAMTSKRSYRGSLSKKQVVGELSQGKGSQFDSSAAEAMLELVESGQVAPIEGDDTTVTL